MDLFILYLTLTVFGVGVTIIDFLGIMDHSNDGSDGDAAHSDSDASGGSDDSGDGGTEHGVVAARGIWPVSEGKHEKRGLRIIARIMSLLRTVVYFSLGFGPTGLFASLSGLSRTKGFIWACAVGVAMTVLARLLRRFIRKDLDSSIKPDELLQEKAVLLLPLEGEGISKATVRQFGREMDIYVRCLDKETKLPKGKEVIVVDYDNDVYWVEPAEK